MSRKPRLGAVNPALSTLTRAADVQEARKLRTGIAELDPAQITTEGRLDDRLMVDVEGLKDSIRTNGQRVPILVRPLGGERYGLIYGRRRLTACAELGLRVRAIVTELDDGEALKDQLLENQNRADLSFIERALVASALLDGDHLPEDMRTMTAVAEVMNLTRAGVSQQVNVVKAIGPELLLAIGAAPGIGRPRWEELKKALAVSDKDQGELIRIAEAAQAAGSDETGDASDRAFMKVLKAATLAQEAPAPLPKPDLTVPGVGSATVRRSARGKRLKLELQAEDAEFAGWLERHAGELIQDLHERWKKRSED